MKTTDWKILAGVSALISGTSLPILVTEAEGQSPWKRHTIDASDSEAGKVGADGVRLADANGDGHLDVVTGWENGDAIRVCLNPGPEDARSLWPGVTVGRVAGAEDAVFADLDSDGQLDVVSCTEGKTRSVFVHWAPADTEKYLDAEAWSTEAIPVLKAAQLWMYCLPFDVNGDGLEDLVLGSKGSGATVGWLERPKDSPRDLSRWSYHSLYDAGWIMSIRAADLDGDGDVDLLFSDRKGPKSGVWWLEQVGRVKGTTGTVFAEPKCLGLAGKEVIFLDVVDLDDDGILDIAAAVRPAKIGLLYQTKAEGGGGSARQWSEDAQAGGLPQDRFGTAKAVRVADLNGDGKLDLAITCENAKGQLSGALSVSLHRGALFGSLRQEDISGAEGVKYDRIELIDLDADGDLDLMTCEERSNLGVFWYENPSR